MSKGSAIVMALIAAVGGFLFGHTLGQRSAGVEGEEIVVDAAAGAGRGADGEGAAERFNVPVTADQPAKGPADALVTIVEFSEFQCPFCNRVQPTLSRIMNEYEGKVRIVWRNQPLPFHPNAGPAAEAAMEAYAQGGAAKFWQLHDLLFQNQRELSRENLDRFAQQVGLDMNRYRTAMDQHTHQAKITADAQLAGRLGNRGTPGFFINGRFLAGAQPFEAFKTVIDEELGRAQQLVRSGTPAAQVYAALTRNAPTSRTEAPAQQPGAQRQQPDPNAVYKVELQGENPQRGPNDALVTIVQISDFECPFCSRVEPTIDQILERYRNDVRVVWLNNPLPFHRNAGPAAQAAMEAFQQGGNDKFWAMHEKLFENQRALARENLESYAQEIGLNMTQLRAALDSNEHQAAIDRAQQLAQRFGASGTPSFFINGRNLRGAQPLEAFTRVIDEELAKARRLVEQGTPRANVYAATIANGATSPQMLAAPAGPAGQPAAPGPDTVYDIPVPANAPSRGPANAQVTIQLFSDYQCPFCSRVEPTLTRVLEEYGNRVRVVWRDMPLPFHQDAMPAAQAAREVYRQGGNAKFWAYHDLLFQNQRALSRENLEAYAQQLGGINMAQFRAALDNETHKAVIEADVRAAQASGARIGTPASFINGRLVSGAQPFEAFKAAIDAALAAR